MDKFTEMQAFTAVVESGSFVNAADLLAMSKPTISRYVAALEQRLGVRLLHRTTRRLSLTEEGEVFYTRCKDLLSGLDEAEAEITERSGLAVGLLKVNAPVTFGIHHLAKLWPEFMQRHPNVTVDITLQDRLTDLVEEGYDLAVRIGRLPASTLISRKLASTRMVLCASPAYLARAGAPEKPADLSQHAIIAYTYFALGDEWPFTGPDGTEHVSVTPCMTANNGDTCLAAALQHKGIILQPTFLVGADLAAGRLVPLLPRYSSIELGIFAIYPSRKHVAPKVRLLIDFLIEAFRQPVWPE